MINAAFFLLFLLLESLHVVVPQLCRNNLLKVRWFLLQNYTFREIPIRYDGHQLLRYDARLPRSVV